MAWIKTAFLTTALLATTLSQAAPKPSTDGSQNSAKAPAHPPYGENPNIFKVFAYKTQEKVISTADKVGEATENGISKIKPKVDQAWDTVTAAPHGVVPIESKPLSQSSTAPNTTPVTSTPNPPRTSAPAAQQAPIAPTSSPSTTAQPALVLPPTSATPPSHAPIVKAPNTQAQPKAASEATPVSTPISNAEPEAETLPKLAPLKPAQAEVPASEKSQSGVFYL